ncbi:uncharacterized protein HaLaN_08843 [Haematococcus lacustris]|uniref:BTBD8 BACK domain-containing protein n=1 Tax=Haematococcus lacustris TaxID=44745 RepID=A0A699ZC47_HAELA|nr:uncharacterized protein HaLaN_08843 [Haematococcus lacustris]
MQAAVRFWTSPQAVLHNFWHCQTSGRLRSAVMKQLRVGPRFCGGLRKPAPGSAPLEAVPQVVTLLSSAAAWVGDADGQLALLQADCENWLAEQAHRAWPTRAFAALDRAIQDRVLRTAVGHLSPSTAFSSLLRCRQLQVSRYAAEHGTPTDALQLLTSWPAVSQELAHLAEELPHVQEAVVALYEQVKQFASRSFPSISRCAAWKSLSPSQQQGLMKDLGVVPPV